MPNGQHRLHSVILLALIALFVAAAPVNASLSSGSHRGQVYEPLGRSTSADTLKPGQKLAPGHSRISSNHLFVLAMQTDGNLVLYRRGYPLWASGTNGHAGAYAVMQTDGNLVVYPAGGGKALWSAGTVGHAGAYAVVQSDGNLVIYSSGGKPLWATGLPETAVLYPGDSLHAGQSITSLNGEFILRMQGDGNLVLYRSTNASHYPLWGSGTDGHPGAWATMQSDGNLVIYPGGGGSALWSSGTVGNHNAIFAIQDDANLVIYTYGFGKALWASNSNTQNSTLHGGDKLTPGQEIVSQNLQYVVVMQGDGNLVIYSHGVALWGSHTDGNPGAWAIMQTDGNLVIYTQSGSAALWSSGTAGHAGAFVGIQPDGNFVIYPASGPPALWATGTGQVSPPQGSDAPTSAQIEAAIAFQQANWARYYPDLCQTLVGDAYPGTHGYDSAILNWQAQVRLGRAHPGDPNAPRGALVFGFGGGNFDPTYGHVGISLGDGTYVSNLQQAPAKFDVRGYLGWAWINSTPGHG